MTTARSSLGRRRERRDVEPATEDAGRREHAPGVFCEQLHPAADGRADVAGKLRIRHRTRRYGHRLGIRLGRKGPTSENGRLVRGTSGVLAARAARGHVRAGSGRARRAQTSGAAGALAARAGPRRLRRPAHRPALARRAAGRRDLDPPGVRLEPAPGPGTEPHRRARRRPCSSPARPVTCSTSRPSRSTRPGSSATSRPRSRPASSAGSTTPPSSSPDALVAVAGPAARRRRVRVVGAVRVRAAQGAVPRRARDPAVDRPRARPPHVGRRRGRAARQGVPGPRAVPRAAHARAVPLGPAGRRAARVPGRARRARRGARHRAGPGTARARGADPRPGPRPRLAGAAPATAIPARDGRGHAERAPSSGARTNGCACSAGSAKCRAARGRAGVAVGRTGHRQDAALRGAERARARSAHARGVGTRLGRRRRAHVLAVGAGAAHARRGHARRRARHRDRRQRRRHRARRPRLRPVRHGRRRRTRRGVGAVPLLRSGRDAAAQPLDAPGRSSSCSTTCTGPTRARSACSSSR